ncbi:hypothetical protein GGTG_13071 [Gaeumannomyces tritici R3-111a-1]|uniref:Uncharacterized protein n=1 Tax=Gaeumannomyces tritici (strain R3-111a-1) TaxID=644352 RepID=J3PHU0_GAET3|nr:hypothetical protein GGTG_13071 [Gaeumannomyces tritici R3-111a-1]EJT69452.1 hypothetical protein GGTG_13071 [Gaeumannomyces tritici R3-111a-1]
MDPKSTAVSSTATPQPEASPKKQGRLSSLLRGMRASVKQGRRDSETCGESRSSFESTDTVDELKDAQTRTGSATAADAHKKISSPRKPAKQPMTNMERLAAGYGAWVPERSVEPRAAPAPQGSTDAKISSTRGGRRQVSSLDRLLVGQGGWVPEERR